MTATTSSTPEHQQRLTALQSANKIRSTRAKFKKDLKADPACAIGKIADVILRPSAEMRTVDTSELIAWLPRYSTHRTRKTLTNAGITRTNCPVGELTARERNALLAVLGSNNTMPIKPPRYKPSPKRAPGRHAPKKSMRRQPATDDIPF